MSFPSDRVPPLSGTVVLDLTSVGPGQFCTRFLADMGADVIAIEAPGRAPLGGERNRRSRYLTRGKRSMTLNLKDLRGQEILHRLVESADVLVEGMRPGVVTRLRADYETLASVNPRIVCCSMSGYGQDGPYAQLAGHDLNYVALGGFLRGTEPGELPTVPPNVLADYAGAAMHAVAGILLALLARERIGVGQYVDVSYLDSTVALMGATTAFRQYAEGGPEMSSNEGVFSGAYPYYAVYRTADERSISIGCLEPWLWKNFCGAVGAPELESVGFDPADLSRAPEPRHRLAKDKVQQLLLAETAATWFERLAEHDVCVAPINNVAQVFEDPQLLHRGMVAELNDGSGGRSIGIPIKLSLTPGLVGEPPLPNEHTRQILAGLGLDEAGIDELAEAGVVAG